MKVNLLETDDRFLHFIKQDYGTDAYVKSIIDSRPFGDNPYYLFYHSRGQDTSQNRRSIWQPRMMKPIPQINSTLIRIQRNSTLYDVIWVIPPVEIWPEFDKGKIHENAVIQESVYMFQKRFYELSQPFVDDLTGDEAQQVMWEMYPLSFIRETLPEDKKAIWDRAKAEKEKMKEVR